MRRNVFCWFPLKKSIEVKVPKNVVLFSFLLVPRSVARLPVSARVAKED